MADIDLSENENKFEGEFDYARIDELVEKCLKLDEFKNIDKFLVWIMATDYWIKEEYNKVCEVCEVK